MRDTIRVWEMTWDIFEVAGLDFNNTDTQDFSPYFDFVNIYAWPWVNQNTLRSCYWY